jgi:hypothetical protein
MKKFSLFILKESHNIRPNHESLGLAQNRTIGPFRRTPHLELSNHCSRQRRVLLRQGSGVRTSKTRRAIAGSPGLNPLHSECSQASWPGFCFPVLHLLAGFSILSIPGVAMLLAFSPDLREHRCMCSPKADQPSQLLAPATFTPLSRGGLGQRGEFPACRTIN